MESNSAEKHDNNENDISAMFQVPSLQIELHGELHGKTHGFVHVQLDGFQLSFNNFPKPFSTIKIMLQCFFIEDLLHQGKDKYRYLIKSSEQIDTSSYLLTERPSSSCPANSGLVSIKSLSKSLPNMLDSFKSNEILDESSFNLSFGRDGCSFDSGPLICVEMTFAGRDSHDLTDEQMQKNINIDVSSLDVVINLQTWVILLEFFGIGVVNPVQSPRTNEMSFANLSEDSDVEMQVSVQADLNINIKSVVLYLNKEQYPLAKASVNDLNLKTLLADGNQDISGSIGNVHLADLSPHCGLYKDRLTTIGKKAFHFSFFRFGPPDPHLKREYDMELTLSMSAIQYVHTQRFLMETISFCQHFLLLQEILARMRAASAGDEVLAIFNRAARLCLKVNADAPILILPRQSRSPDLLVANLGKLAIDNHFIYASDPSTNAFHFIANRYRNNGAHHTVIRSNDRLLDSIQIKLSDMKVFSAIKTETTNHQMIGYEQQGSEMMSETCMLELTIERNLEWVFGRQVPDMSITGSLSSVYINMDLSQYSLVMGMLGENLGEPLDAFAAPSSVLVDPLVMSSPTKQLWTTMHLKLHLTNVTVEISPTFSFGEIPTHSSAPQKLAKFDLLCSDLIYESFSDESKSVDLVSTDVLVHDIRSTNKIGILLPSNHGVQKKGYLQFEVHYLDTKEKSLVTFLCNQSRILLEFDLLLQTWRFITRKEENEFKENHKMEVDTTFLPHLEVAVSPGVLTKSMVHNPPTPKKAFELKINITESELIVVEDILDEDTRTVILKTTAVFAYRPDHSSERPISCSLQNLEVFSCQMSQPDNSALSIVDPVAFLVELNSVKKVISSSSVGLLDAVKSKPSLEIQFQAPVYVRLSYYDVQMFMQIATSAKEQFSNAMQGTDKKKEEENLSTEDINTSSLEDLGFSKEDCIKAMQVSKNDLSTAALWLTTNVEVTKIQPARSSSLAGIEVKANLISVILIDDCGNNDVPLLDVLFKDLLLHHNFEHDSKGLVKCHIDAKYYNTRVSAWEPFIEGWKFNVHWFKSIEYEQQEKLVVKIDAPERLDMNVTSAFVDIVKQTTSLWSTRFYTDVRSKEKKRAPFLPFLVRNKTGCKISFHTVVKSPMKLVTKVRKIESRNDGYPDNGYELVDNEEVAFSFEGRSKQRHQVTHQLMVHQIIVEIFGWQQMVPLTVDRVGQFFRIAYPTQNDETSNDSSSIYIIFDITLEGARKVINIKSALSIENNLSVPVELIGEINDKHYNIAVLGIKQTYAIPVSMTTCKLYCKPLKANSNFAFCSEDLNWRDVLSNGETGITRSCQSKLDGTFRFCALVSCIGLQKRLSRESMLAQHNITLVHQIILENHLPFDLFYLIRGSPMKELVKPGETLPLHVNDSSVEIGFSFENFPAFDFVKISNEGMNYVLPARVYDTRNRLLILNTVISCRSGTVHISVFAPYWLINKTGIPLIFKREDDSEEISGQFEEHEEARSLTPLPFSYLSSEYSFQCQMRLGKFYQPNDGMTPLWCKPFSLENQTENRTLYVRQGRDRYEKSYDIGIVMNWGNGVFSRTRIVSFVSRFQLDNQTTQTLVIAQKPMIKDDKSVPNTSLMSHPGTMSFFHWPRSDFDKILCVKLGCVDSCLWSGGVRLDCVTSYFLKIKSTKTSKETHFHAHVSFHAGTYRCTFTDANAFPPPYMIVNLSEVNLLYWQENASSIHMRNSIKANEMKEYVLDEPLLQPHLTVSVHQESTVTYNLKNSSKHLSKLYYQNSIFIALTHTFPGNSCARHSTIKNTSEQLVLDVIENKYVIFAKKAEHKRSQLWRMNVNGNLVHFGSSAPTDGRQTSNKQKCLVLDVEEIVGKPYFKRLVLNPLSDERSSTQTWFFESNMLRCCLSDIVVQYHGKLQSNALAVLSQKPNESDKLCSNVCISRQKLRPGSGVLSVRVFSQGPTQVIEISDAHHEAIIDPFVIVNRSHSNMHLTTSYNVSNSKSSSTEIHLSLAGGFGVSVINLHPEEVLFVSLSQIRFCSQFNSTYQSIELQLGAIQIDNQLFGCQIPVVVFASPLKKKSVKENYDMLLDVQIEKDKDYNMIVFKKCAINVCKLHVQLEDKLLLKIIQAAQSLFTSKQQEGTEETKKNIFDSHKLDEPLTNANGGVFFENITIDQGDLNMSLLATGKLDTDLLILKKQLGIPFVSFEDAVIGFERFQRNNVFETKSTLLTNILDFYKEAFKSQAAVLLGSLDILGNPMGFIQDFSSGVEGLLKKGNIGGLFVNVAHGFSDSAAKMTGVIADGLWTASMDNKFQESRDSLRVARASSSSSHFSAGLKGLGMGVIGGLTSMVTQPIEGASKEGVTGFFTGIGKGLVGTVAKPMAGVLDLASGTAAAVRMTTESATPAPQPVRMKRNCYGPGGVLVKYSKNSSEGQEILLKFNEGNPNELYVSMEPIRPTGDRLKAMLTNKGIYFVKSGPPSPENIFLHVGYSMLLDSSYYFEDRQHFIEIYLCRRRAIDVREKNADRRATVRCDNERIAYRVSQKMNYLKSLHDEALFAIEKIVSQIQ